MRATVYSYNRTLLRGQRGHSQCEVHQWHRQGHYCFAQLCTWQMSERLRQERRKRHGALHRRRVGCPRLSHMQHYPPQKTLSIQPIHPGRQKTSPLEALSNSRPKSILERGVFYCLFVHLAALSLAE